MASRHRPIRVIVFLPPLQVRDRIQVHRHRPHATAARDSYPPYRKVQRIQQRRNQQDNPNPSQHHLERKLLDDEIFCHTLLALSRRLAERRHPSPRIPIPIQCPHTYVPGITFVQFRASRAVVYGKIEVGKPIIVSKQTASFFVISAVFATFTLAAPLVAQAVRCRS